MFSLKPVTHVFEISAGYEISGMNFTIDASGKVTIAAKPEAAIVKDTLINGKKVAKIVFNTANVTIMPNGAPCCIGADLQPYVNYQSNTQPKTFTLIRGLSYMVATSFLGSKVPNGYDEKPYNPEIFFFHLDKQGNVSPDDSLVAKDILSATYKSNVVSLNTVEVNIDSKMFNATKLTIGGLGDIKKPSTIKLTKGIGTTIKYQTKKGQRVHLLIPF